MKSGTYFPFLAILRAVPVGQFDCERVVAAVREPGRAHMYRTSRAR